MNNYRDCAKSGKTNLGGNIRDTGGFHKGPRKMANGGMVFLGGTDQGEPRFADLPVDEPNRAASDAYEAASAGPATSTSPSAASEAYEAASAGPAAASAADAYESAHAPAADNSGAPPAAAASAFKAKVKQAGRVAANAASHMTGARPKAYDASAEAKTKTSDASKGGLTDKQKKTIDSMQKQPGGMKRATSFDASADAKSGKSGLTSGQKKSIDAMKKQPGDTYSGPTRR